MSDSSRTKAQEYADCRFIQLQDSLRSMNNAKREFELAREAYANRAAEFDEAMRNYREARVGLKEFPT